MPRARTHSLDDEIDDDETLGEKVLLSSVVANPFISIREQANNASQALIRNEQQTKLVARKIRLNIHALAHTHFLPCV